MVGHDGTQIGSFQSPVLTPTKHPILNPTTPKHTNNALSSTTSMTCSSSTTTARYHESAYDPHTRIWQWINLSGLLTDDCLQVSAM